MRCSVKKRKRVKVREAWVVRLNGAENPRWVAGDWCGVANERVTNCRDGRWLFCTRERALTVAGQAEREVTWCDTATVIRVTFYEVRRGG